MLAALAIGGWVTAAVTAFEMRRARGWAMEGVVRGTHEVRGALCAVRLGVELAARTGELPAQRARALELELGRAALALEELDRRPLSRALERVDMRQLVADSLEAWRGAAAARGTELRLGWSGAGAIVLGDPRRLAQATANLISNAIEHGGGAVDIRGRLEAGGVRVEVIDGGSGLPAPVAELAGRARAGRGRRGRGLAIASEVARAHGGRLAAAPSERGARLVLELPCVPELGRRVSARAGISAPGRHQNHARNP